METTLGVTLREVAAEAGVSLATASRAFKAADLLASETRQRVVDAAIRVGYDVPAPYRSRTIAVVVPDISNAVYAGLVKTIQDMAWTGRHRMILADTGEDPSRELEFLEMLRETADGIILCSPRSTAAQAALAAGETPLVVVNGEALDAPVVLMDVEQGMGQAMEHIQSLGHESLAYVPGPAASWANGARHQLLRQLALERGLRVAVVGHQSANVHGGLAAAAAVVATKATAVIAYNDLVAIGVQAGARSLGLKCPDDLSIIGIDDLDISAASDPGLTTIRLDIDGSGALALEMVTALIDGKPVTRRAVRLGSQLIVRGSTARR